MIFEIRRELREKNREYELLRRGHAEARRAVELLQAQLDEQARLLAERGMVLVGGADEEDEVGGESDAKKKAAVNGPTTTNGPSSSSLSSEEQDARTRAIVSAETAAILSGLGSGPLDVRIKRLADERDDLQVRRRRTCHARKECPLLCEPRSYPGGGRLWCYFLTPFRLSVLFDMLSLTLQLDKEILQVYLELFFFRFTFCYLYISRICLFYRHF